MINTREVSYIDAITAKSIDESLMSSLPGKSGRFTLGQLMELAGLSVASATHDFFINYYNHSCETKKVCIICGPGNNGGDGLVAARHLRHFGYDITLLAPPIIVSLGKPLFFPHLIQQCEDLLIPIHSNIEKQGLGMEHENQSESESEVSRMETIDSYFSSYDMIIDAMFGFSFKGPAREPYASYIQSLSRISTPTISVDIPSGWDVEQGDLHNTGFIPTAVISLTVPKLCMKGYAGEHYVGGRFVPPFIISLFNLTLPEYFGANQFVKLSSVASTTSASESASTASTTRTVTKENVEIASTGQQNSA